MASNTRTHHPRDTRDTHTEPRWAARGPTLPVIATALITVGVMALVVHLASKDRGRLTRAWTTTTRTGATGRPWFRKETQREIMERAMRMKEEAGPQTNIPEYETSHEGAIKGGQINYTDTRLGREGTYVENTGRSRGARASDGGGNPT